MNEIPTNTNEFITSDTDLLRFFRIGHRNQC